MCVSYFKFKTKVFFSHAIQNYKNIFFKPLKELAIFKKLKYAIIYLTNACLLEVLVIFNLSVSYCKQFYSQHQNASLLILNFIS